MKKRIRILATGGTIAGTRDAKGGYIAGQINVETLLQSLPRRPDDVELSFEQLANVGSQSISTQIWCKLASRINEVICDDLADGVVITHGTDTMEETAYFLNLLTSGRIPVVLTGAMKPADAFSPDGPENLLSAIRVASCEKAANLGVLVVMNAIIHSARYVQKIGSNQDNAFQSAPLGPIGHQYDQNTHFSVAKLAVQHTRQTIFTQAIHEGSLTLSEEMQLPDVDVLYIHGGMQDTLLNYWMSIPRKGIVVAGVGAGNINEMVESLLAQQVANGVVVVRSTRLAFGNVQRNIEVNDDKHGFIAAGSLSPAKARLLLQLALAMNLSAAQIQKLYNTH